MNPFTYDNPCGHESAAYVCYQSLSPGYLVRYCPQPKKQLNESDASFLTFNKRYKTFTKHVVQ